MSKSILALVILTLISLELFSQVDKIEDIVVSHYSTLSVADYDDESNLYLSFSMAHGDVLIFDGTGRIIHKWNHSGFGPYEYDMIISGALVGDNQVLLRSSDRFILYSIGGTGVDEYSTSFLPMPPFVNSRRIMVDDSCDSLFIFDYGIFGTERNFTDYAIFDEVHFVRKLLFGTKLLRRYLYVDIPDGSQYKKNKGIYPSYLPLLDYSTNEKKIFSIFPYDQILDVHDVESGVNKSYKLKPEYFGKTIFYTKNNSSVNEIEQYHQEQLNSEYHNIFYDEDSRRIVTHYSTGLKDVITDNHTENYRVFELRKHYLSLYDINGVKLGKDIELPKNTKIISHFHSYEKILLKVLTESDEQGEQFVLINPSWITP